MENASWVLTMEYDTAATPYEPHFHYAVELLYVLRGQARLRVEGRQEVLGPHTLAFLSPREEHAVDILATPYERYHLTLDPRGADQALSDARLLSVLHNRPAGFKHGFFLPEAEPLLRAMGDAFAADTPYRKERLAAYVKLLLMEAYDRAPERFPLPPRRVKAGVQDVRRYLDTHFDEPIIIQDLARKCFIDPYYMGHCFKELTGLSPKQYLLRTRLAYARDLLEHTGLPVQEVAVRSGFTEAGNFIRQFRRQYGCTPGQMGGKQP